MKYLMIVTLFLSTAAFAQELSFSNYIKMQEALAGDDFKGALVAHKAVCDKDLKSFKNTYKDCSKTFKDVESLRESFKGLSQIYLKNGNKKEASTLSKVHCPMAGASWVQKNGKIANPYYGKSMLECGEFVK